MEKTRSFNLLGNVTNKSTPTFKTLEGFQQSLMKHMGLTSFPLIMLDNTYAELRKDPEFERYPFGYFKLSNFSIIKDNMSLKTLGRHSSGISYDEYTNSVIAKEFMFPLHLQAEAHFITNDFGEAINILEKVGMIDAVDKFTFKLHVPPFKEFTVSVNLTSSDNSIPGGVLEDPQNPGSYDIVFSFIIKTHCGISKSVPKINNEGAVTKRVTVEGHTP